MIPEQFVKTAILYQRYKEFMLTFPDEYYEQLSDMDLEDTIEDPLTGERWDMLLSNTFAQEYTDLIKEKEYFTGCPVHIYQEDFHRRKRNYLVSNPDTLDIDFFLSEYENLALPVFDLTLPNVVKSIQHSIIRTREFLDTEVAKTSYTVLASINDSGKPQYTYKKKDIVEISPTLYSPDYSDNSKIERVAYLEILGVIEFIKKKTDNISETALSSVLSGFTGVDGTTLKSYLTGIDHPESKNNPLRDPKKVKAIKDKLQKLGVKLTN
ncbi:hypothetical protein AMR72_08585 [Flavobacterium psychrophilum]|nr:hypothetical protein AMR72_08585 [Flavobacterium psychrophilum]AOE52555.1 hypothetical protein ALW18_08575 [Flavobacterium psychrophilum]